MMLSTPGVNGDMIMGSLVALAPTFGVNRLVVAAPALAVALGYDLDPVLESLDQWESFPVHVTRRIE
jgi:hypothetical protein